jgi:hypothetical protein
LFAIYKKIGANDSAYAAYESTNPKYNVPAELSQLFYSVYIQKDTSIYAPETHTALASWNRGIGCRIDRCCGSVNEAGVQRLAPRILRSGEILQLSWDDIRAYQYPARVI